MCLLTLMPHGVNIDYEKAKQAAKSNPDGFGFAIHAETAIIKDHDMDFDKLWVRWANLRETYQGAALFHWRISTHGTTSIDNCHPFNLGGDDKTVLGHNGMLPIVMPVHDTRSDTKLFAEYVLPGLGGVVSLDDEETFKDIEKWATGSKLAVLTVNPSSKCDWYILNEPAGHWLDGMWWSNSSYKKTYPLSYVNYGYTGSGYTTSANSSTKRYGGYGTATWDLDDEEEFDAYNQSWKTDFNKLDQLELMEYIEDELYDDESIVDKIHIFTEYTNPDFAKATCYNCGSIYFVDALDHSATHCGDCKNCMACGNAECNCWNGYEYDKSFFVWDAQKGEVNVKKK